MSEVSEAMKYLAKATQNDIKLTMDVFNAVLEGKGPEVVNALRQEVALARTKTDEATAAVDRAIERHKAEEAAIQRTEATKRHKRQTIFGGRYKVRKSKKVKKSKKIRKFHKSIKRKKSSKNKRTKRR